MEYRKRVVCTGCGSADFLKEVLHFGKIPLAGYFPVIQDIKETRAFDCNLLICDNCGMLQVDTLVNGDILFSDYRYISSVGLAGHFSEVASYLDKRFSLKENNALVLEIGSNDGVLLEPLKKLGISAVGFEPSVNISSLAKQKGCEVIVDFFNYETAVKTPFRNTADLMVANNVFAHIDDLNSVVNGIKYCLTDKGTFVAEVHYLLDLVVQNQYDFIYHEHIYYHSLFSLNNFFRRHGMTLYDFDLINVHSGSVRIFVRKGIEDIPKQIASQIEREINSGITNSAGFVNFSNSVSSHIKSCKEIIKTLLDQGRTIIGFGASGRCNIFCNLLGLGTESVKYIFDQSPERTNRFIPGCNIPIIRFDDASGNEDYDIVLIFAWNFSNMIMKKIKAANYLILFPQAQLVEAGDKIEGIL